MSLNLTGWLEALFAYSINKLKKIADGRLSGLAFFVIATGLLTLNFAFNMFSAAPDFWFHNFDHASESLVFSGIVRQNSGKLEKGMMLGRYAETKNGELKDTQFLEYLRYIEDQVSIFEGKLPSKDRVYVSYFSQYGLQAPLLASVDRVTMGFRHILTSTPKLGERTKWSLGRKISASRTVVLRVCVGLFSAIAVAAFLAWIYTEISPASGTWCLFAAMASGWLTVFGNDIYWMIGSWFLPTVVLCWLHYWVRKTHRFKAVVYLFGFTVFALFIYFKCLMGYEYISTVCISACIPIIYYSFLDKESLPLIVGRLTAAGVFAMIGFGFAVVAHLHQIAALQSSSDPFSFLRILIFKSTLPVGSMNDIPAMNQAALNFNPLLLLAMYVFLPLNQHSFFIPAILPLLLGVTIGVRLLRQRKDDGAAVAAPRALAVAALVSILAPLSWYILAKGHSARHFQYNFVLWYLPTVFWMVALIAAHYRILLPKTKAAPVRQEYQNSTL